MWRFLIECRTPKASSDSLTLDAMRYAASVRCHSSWEQQRRADNTSVTLKLSLLKPFKVLYFSVLIQEPQRGKLCSGCVLFCELRQPKGVWLLKWRCFHHYRVTLYFFKNSYDYLFFFILSNITPSISLAVLRWSSLLVISHHLQEF